ncbi:zinc metalloprotease [Spirochaetia bacterium]|nr:zinc metalloprotease [Spirochaetia bacterium]
MIIIQVIIKVILGLIGLGIVVFVHELGHFIAARLAGIEVEAFSIGWGKAILKKKIGAVEYRLGIFPIGGYCKMRGENEFHEAWESKNPDPKTFLGAKPWKRIGVAFAGPFFNFIFAIIVLSVIWGRGIEINTLENRIVLLADIDGKTYPSDQGGLRTGDRIISIDGKEIANFRDIQENIAFNADTDIPVTVLRNGETVNLTIHSSLDKTGAGKIGVYHWTEPVVQSLRSGSPAEKAGLKPGDRITGVHTTGDEVSREILYTVAFLRVFAAEKPPDFFLDFERNGKSETTELSGVEYPGGFPDLGIEYPSLQFKTPALSPFNALATGSGEAAKIFAVSVKGLGLLFKKDIDLTQAVSGPARITYMVGEIAVGGFEESVGTGFSTALNFLALISIALCLMNLLPLPILDGGMIILFLVEMIRQRPLHPRAVSVFQTAGMVIIFSLMIFAVFNDIVFFTGR